MRKNLTKFLMLLGVFILLGAGKADAYYWTIRGDFNNWSSDLNSSVTAAPDNNGNVTLYAPLMYGYFKVYRYEGDNMSTTEYTDIAKFTTVTSPSGYTLKLESKSSPAAYFALSNGTVAQTLYEVTIVLNVSDKQINSIKISGSATPTRLYLIGQVGSWDAWNPTQGIKMKDENGIYTLSGVRINGNFALATTLGSSDNDWNTLNKNRFGPKDNNKEAVIGSNTVDGSGDLSWSISNIKDGKYDVKFDSRTRTLSLTKSTEPVVITWILRSNLDGTWRDYPFIQSEDSKYIWTVSIPGVRGKEFGLKRLQDSYYKDDKTNWFTKINGSISENAPSLQLETTTQSDKNIAFDLDDKKIYTFTWNTRNNTLSVEESKSVYMYGHINGGSWDLGNYVELEYNSKSNCYETTFVDIQGQWNEHDKELNTNRKLWDKASPNYFAFYPQIQTEKDFNEKSPNHMKFVTTNNSNCKIEGSTDGAEKWYPYAYREETETYNFQVDKEDPDKDLYNFYAIKFDAVNHRVLFTPVKAEKNEKEQIVRAYSWYSGDDHDDDKDNAKRRSMTADGKYYTYSFSYDDIDSKNVVQVALFSNPKHDAARQAVYTVKKKISGSSLEANGKRRVVNENEYETIEPGNDFEIKGTSSYDDNVLVHFKTTGEYLVTADIDPNAKDGSGKPLSNTYDVQPSSILVTIANAQIEGHFVADNTDETIQPWSMTKGNQFTINLESTSVNADMLEVTVTPVQTSGEWETNDGNRPETFDPYVWGQMTGIQSTAYKVDGYYDASLAENSLEGEEKNNEYNVTVSQHFPCSGVYTLSVDVKDAYKTQYDLNVPSQTVTIYPTILNVYPTVTVEVSDNGNTITPTVVAGKSSSYSVFDNYPKSKGEAGTVISLDDGNGDIQYGSLKYTAAQLPTEYQDLAGQNLVQMFWQLGNATFYTPGIYLAEADIQTSSNKTNVNARRVRRNEGEVEYITNFYSLDLSDLEEANHTASNNIITVYVKMTKNGATTPVLSDGYSVERFQIKSTSNVPTGVDTVGVEEADGEAVYYNLQGVRVANPEHGIFVKVVNGKASKVVM